MKRSEPVVKTRQFRYTPGARCIYEVVDRILTEDEVTAQIELGQTCVAIRGGYVMNVFGLSQPPNFPGHWMGYETAWYLVIRRLTAWDDYEAC